MEIPGIIGSDAFGLRDLDAHASVNRVLVGVACAFELFVVRLAVSRARAKPAQKVRDCKNLWGQCGEKIGDSYYDFARAMAM